MTPKQYAEQFNRQHRAYERKAVPIFYKALRAQVTPVLDFMQINGTLSDSDIDRLVSVAPMKRAYSIVYENTGVDAALREFTLLRKEEPVKADIITEFFSRKWALLMREYALLNVADLVQKVSDHTKEQIRFALAKSYEEGMTFTQQIKLIREYTLGEIGRNRALTIARTESTRATAEGKRIGATDWAKENGTILYHKWIHTGRTEHDRKFHQSMDREKPIPADQDYIVLGERMNGPGDPKASPKNTINCACTEMFMSERKARRDYGVAGGSAVNPISATTALSGFIPAKDVEEAKKRYKELGVLQADLDRMHLSHINATLRAMEVMPKKAIPDVFGNGATYKRAMDMNIERRADSWYGVSTTNDFVKINGVRAWNDMSRKSIASINSTTFKTVDEITKKKETYQALYKNKYGNYYFFNTKGELTHFHELGHVFDQKTFTTSGKDWKELSERWYKESKYDVLKSPSEAWAEGWADYYGNDAKRIPSYIKEFIEQLIKRHAS